MSLGMSFVRRRMMAAAGEPPINPVLNNNSWEVISNVATAGEGENYWSIGDRKSVVLNGTVGKLSLSNYTIFAFIIGFNHNANVEGSGRIHFQIGKTALSGGTDVALCDERYGVGGNATGYFNMNGTLTNSGGWASSQMRTSNCGTSLADYSGTIIGIIPKELREALKSVTKYTDNRGGGRGSSQSYVTATTDYFFLLSEYEVFGTITRGNTYEASKQKQYEYYSVGNSKVKNNHGSPISAVYWWLRSPRADAGTMFMATTNSGTIVQSAANVPYGFAPAFCV